MNVLRMTFHNSAYKRPSAMLSAFEDLTYTASLIIFILRHYEAIRHEKLC